MKTLKTIAKPEASESLKPNLPSWLKTWRADFQTRTCSYWC